MSSKLTLVSVMVLAAFLAGCNSTKTASIDPGGNGGNNGGENGGGNNGGGGDGGDGGNNGGGDGGNNGGGDGGNNGGGDGGNNGGGDNGGGDGGNPTTHILKGRFLSFNKVNSGNPEVMDGTMTVTIPAGATSPATVAVAGTATPVPGATLPGTPAGVYGTVPDNFLDLSQSGDNYTIGTYVTNDANNWHVGAAVGGEKTDQIGASATYTGKARAAVVPVGWSQDVQPYEATGDVSLDLNVTALSATVEGQITNVRAPGLLQSNDPLPGQITLQQADVVNGAYSGEVTGNLGGGTGRGGYDGAFYGADAAETAGTFEMDGNAQTPDGALTYTVIGSFGAKK